MIEYDDDDWEVVDEHFNVIAIDDLSRDSSSTHESFDLQKIQNNSIVISTDIIPSVDIVNSDPVKPPIVSYSEALKLKTSVVPNKQSVKKSTFVSAMDNTNKRSIVSKTENVTDGNYYFHVN